MADKELTQADIDAAVEKAVGPLKESLDKAESKNAGLLDDLKKAQREARAAKDIKPEDLAAAEDRAEKAETALAEATKQVKTLTTERDKAVKSLETEQGAARSYALDAEINGAIAAGNIVPGLVPAFTAMVKQQAKADLVDGKYVVSIGDKPAKDYITSFLESEGGKDFKAAPVNSGAGVVAPRSGAPGSKTMTRSAFDAADPAARLAFSKEGGVVVDA